MVVNTPSRETPGRGIIRGIALLATFRTRGLGMFGDSNQQILNSLVPLLAFPVVFMLLLLIGGGAARDIAELLSLICALLAQMVLSAGLARVWGREAEWGRYAVALNWCQWAVPAAGLALLLSLRLLVGMGLPEAAAPPLALLALAGYALVLQWFIARHGLRISGGRAAAVVLALNLATAAVVFIPTQLQLLIGGDA